MISLKHEKGAGLVSSLHMQTKAHPCQALAADQLLSNKYYYFNFIESPHTTVLMFGNVNE